MVIFGKSISFNSLNLNDQDYVGIIFSFLGCFFVSLYMIGWYFYVRKKSKLNILDYVFGYYFGIYCNIVSIQNFGATLVSSILGFRLIITILISNIFLNEKLESFTEIVGCLLVIVSVSLNIIFQSKNEETNDKSKV
eukprot:gene8528-352_t